MQLFDIIAILVTLTALLSYVNHRYVRLHPSIGVMLIALLLSLALIGLGHLGFGLRRAAADFLSHIEFGKALLTWMLGFLLFAGALKVDIGELQRRWRVSILLATVGTAASMFIVASLAWEGLRLIGMPMRWIWCLLLGALISPTDPVAVIAVIREAGAGKEVETVAAAESLFNDGVGVVLFLTSLHVLQSSARATIAGVGGDLLRQVVGGGILGFASGLTVYYLLRHAREFQVKVLLTVALVMGTYSLAAALDTSAPIAVVVAGLLIGNRGKIFHMAEHVSADLDRFWELVDEILNTMLFVLIGAEVLVMTYTPRHFLAAVVAVPMVLLARTVTLLPCIWPMGWKTTAVLIWGGLRGGLAVAMALSLPMGHQRDLILAITYGVVCFSILVQGTTIRGLVRRTIHVSSGGPSR
jgi:Na+:H+ antiporter